MKKYLFTLPLFLIINSYLYGQNNYTFSGIVQDSGSGDFIPFALLYDTLSGKHTETDQYGRFSITLRQNSYHFVISNVGYSNKTITFLLNKDIKKNIYLSNITLPELVIQGTQSIHLDNGYIDMSPEKIKSIPTLLGEKDALKALAILPGVASGNDGTNQISVRGGGYDQNLILLDGSILYNTSHLFGFLSAIEPFAIKSMRFYKDGFPSEYGGRLSSIVDIKLKEGNFVKNESYINVGLVTSSFGINGPLKKNKFSFLLSSRIAYPGMFTLPFKARYESNNSNSFVSYFMYDLVAKLNYKISENHNFYLSGTLGKDFLNTGTKENNFRTDLDLNWGNSVVAFRYNGILSKSIRLNFSSNFNKYNYKTSLKGTELVNGYKANIRSQSTIQDFKLTGELNWNIFSTSDLVSGISYTTSAIKPVFRFFDASVDTSSSLVTIPTNEISIYQTFKSNLINSSLKLNLGYRYSKYQINFANFNYFQPRVLLSYAPIPKLLDFYFSYSKMYQPVHQFLNPSNGYINEVWLSANNEVPPQEMSEVSLGVHYNKSWGDLRIAFFNRRFSKLIEIKDNVKLVKFFSNNWNDLFEKDGLGKSYGIEFSYIHSFKKLNWITSYTLNNSLRTFKNINEGRTFPSPVDRPHVLSINTDFVKNEKTSFTIGVTYFSGTPITLPEYYIRTSSLQRFAYTDRYNSRLPSYKRVDIGYKKSYTNSKGLPKEWSFSIYNVFFNRNITQIIPQTIGIPTPGMPSVNIGEKPYFDGRSFFNFIPGINFYYKFK